MMTENTRAQMRKGVLELCILALLDQQALYPSELLVRLREAELLVVEGTIYPLLNRMKNAGLLEYEWRESSAGPPRKYYRLTESGRDMRRELQAAWTALVGSVSQTLENHES